MWQSILRWYGCVLMKNVMTQVWRVSGVDITDVIGSVSDGNSKLRRVGLRAEDALDRSK